MSWSVADMPDCSEQVAVVTGANSGLGLETTRGLAKAGATVVLACRSTERAEAAVADVRQDVPDADLAVEELDLADLESVHAFADRLDREVDVLVNNAGLMAIPRRETADGFEMQFGVNHLGHFALTGLLLDDLTPDARVVTVSSGVHERGRIDFDRVARSATDSANGEAVSEDLQRERGYDKWDAYAQSKLANLLFAYELDRRLEAAGSDVLSVGTHPGFAATNLQERGPAMAGATLRKYGMKVANLVFAQSAADGALPTLYAATDRNVVGGAYYGPGGFVNMRGPPERQESSRRSRDPETARRLWDVSEELTGVTYDLPEP